VASGCAWPSAGPLRGRRPPARAHPGVCGDSDISLPLSSAPVNEFCPLSEDVCAFPSGDRDAKMAVRALMLTDKSKSCIEKFSNFICALHFPPCRFRVTIPLCYDDCMDTHMVGDSCCSLPASVCVFLMATRRRVLRVEMGGMGGTGGLQHFVNRLLCRKIRDLSVNPSPTRQECGESSTTSSYRCNALVETAMVAPPRIGEPPLQVRK